PRAVPFGKVDRLDGPAFRRAGALDKGAKISQRTGFGKGTFVDTSLEGILHCDHQLDPFEGAEAELFDRRGGRDLAAPRIFRNEHGQRVGGGARLWRFRAVLEPVPDFAALILGCAFGAWQLGVRSLE